MLESADRADSNSAVRKDVWVQVPPAVPDPLDHDVSCRASPPDVTACIDDLGRGRPYPHLLGLYLGDGMLSLAHRGVWRLRITLDARYPGIVARAQASIGEVAARTAGTIVRPGCIEVYSDWKHWPCAFPQHGAGRKHERPITLERWQIRLVAAHPGPFLAGLIHSDGCRFINRVASYAYPRYMFSNESADIRDLFSWACALEGIACRPAGRRNISVARREAVAAMDRLVGPKV